jgi:hypothetical protein
MDDNCPLVISYENDNNNDNSLLFKTTLEKRKWDFVFIGANEKWLGVKNKIIGYFNYLRTLSENKLVVLSDARDVFCLRDTTSFFDIVKDIVDSKIIISSECFLLGHMNWNETQISKELTQNPNYFYQGVPLNKYWEYYNISPLRKYINSGLIVGRVKQLTKAFKWIIDNNYEDDQLGFANYSNTYPERVYLDYDANILHTSTGFVDGCLYDYNVQKEDVPTFTELFGLSNYFLHIPGITISKGQQNIYNLVSNLFKNQIINKDMFEIYNLKNKTTKNVHFIHN